MKNCCRSTLRSINNFELLVLNFVLLFITKPLEVIVPYPAAVVLY